MYIWNGDVHMLYTCHSVLKTFLNVHSQLKAQLAEQEKKLIDDQNKQLSKDLREKMEDLNKERRERCVLT